MREIVLRRAAPRAAALALAGLLALPLSMVQRQLPLAARGLATPPGETVVGEARVVDGDTLVVGAVRVRLEGIDAPEQDQTCGRAWLGTWSCGREATEHLALLVRDRTVECQSRGRDAYGRMLGVCVTEGLELNADMVRNGLAWAFIKYSQRYVELEAEARAAKRGIWQGAATPAWEWRAERWRAAEGEKREPGPANCVIKGNITRNGHVYHMPWDRWYGKTRIETAKGERWFCSEGEAVAAGWRPASSR